MSDIRPTKKIISYPHLTAEVNYTERVLTILDNTTGESMSFNSEVYPELQHIMAEIGHQSQSGGLKR